MTAKPVIHLELHTGDLAGATDALHELCGWTEHRVDTGAGPYHALDFGNGMGGGIVESPTPRAIWLPYVEVPEIRAATERARQAGARVVVDSREGPAGFRTVVSTPGGGEIAFWQQKR
jgi:predicted enzyme related to lactoylglutathione lyase